MFPPEAMEEQVQIIGVDIDYKLELNCAGPRHAFFMDKDGSLTGISIWHLVDVLCIYLECEQPYSEILGMHLDDQAVAQCLAISHLCVHGQGGVNHWYTALMLIHANTCLGNTYTCVELQTSGTLHFKS